MVWSDQSQFPFYVIDNNGNIILTIDETGLHLDGTTGHIDMQVSAGQPTIFFSNLARTIRAYINAPGGSSVAIGSPDYASSFPGNPLVHNISWVSAGQTELGQVKQGTGDFVGGYIKTQDNVIELEMLDITGAVVNHIQISNTGIILTDGANGFGLSQTSGLLHRVIAGTYKGWSTLLPFYVNGWGDLGGTWETGAYKLSPDGFVTLRGVIIGGTKTDGTVIATVPVEARPLKDKILPIALVSAGATQPNVQCRMNTAGQLTCFGISTTTTGNLSLEGVRYSLFNA